MKTKQLFRLLTALSFLLATLPVQAAQASPAESAAPADLLQFTAGGHALGFTADGMYAATGSHALHVGFTGANAVQPQADSPASADGATVSLSRVAYANLWEGITLTYAASEGSVYTTTYTLASGANPDDIRLRYNAGLTLNEDGTLSIGFEAGTMTESAPIAWQEIDGRRESVDVAYRVSGQEVGFTLGSYNPGYALTIDPSLVWNTFLGGSETDNSYGIAVDGSGNVYVAGSSPAAWGSPVRAHAGGYDAFAAKLNAAGSLTWITFLGGSEWDYGNGIAVDGSGNVYVAGYSSNTWGSPVRAYTGGYDAFAVKLTSTGALTWNTFLGGSAYEYGYGIAVDGSGNVYVSGSGNATWGSPVRAHTGGNDAFAVKLTSAGALTWNTFLGGSGWDDGFHVAVDGSGNVYVAGDSDETWGSPVRAYTGDSDAFAAKLASTGALTWNTFLGGSGGDVGIGIAVDGSGNVYVAGYSDAAWGSPVRAYTAGNDAFAAELDSAGALTWSTFLGGSGDDGGYAIAVDGSGNVFVSARSNWTWGSPVRPFAGSYDAFAAKLDTAGSLTWNTFLGGNGYDAGSGIAVDGNGNIYIAGTSGDSWGSPVRGFTGGFDTFAAKLTSAGGLTWNTFLGGCGYDQAQDIAVDGSGNVYVTGASTAAWGSPIRAHGGGNEAFAAKLNSAGGLTWNTFLGGSGEDSGYDIAVDGSGNVYVTGVSDATWGSPVRAHSGGGNDAFAAKLNASGGLTWHAFLGGSAYDTGAGIAVDGNGNVYVAGTSSAAWGTPVRTFTGISDAFAAKLDSAGGLTWNTFLGGFDADSGYAITVDGNGNVYISGFSDDPWGTPVRDYSSEYEAFAAKLDSAGGLTWNTFLGGSGNDVAYGIAVDGSGNVYVTGYSEGTWGSPVRAHEGNMDAFTAKLDSAGALTWNTFLGGSGNDNAYSIAVNGSGSVFVTGNSSATWGNPVNGYIGLDDAVIATLNSAGNLTSNTFLGGSGNDIGYGIAVDGNWNVYVAGVSQVGWGSPVRAYTGSADAFVAKLHLALPGALNKLSPASGMYGSPAGVTLSWEASSDATGYEYCYDLSDDGECNSVWVDAGSATSGGISGLSLSSTYYWQVRATNGRGETYANGGTGTGTWWSLKTGLFADVPVAGKEWMRNWIEGFYNAGITTGCGIGPLGREYCPEREVTRAEMAVFLLRAKHGAGYVPPAATGVFGDVPFAGKEWMQPWIEQFYREGITTGCGAGPIYCPERAVTRAEMAVFVLRAKHGASYVPPAATGVFLDVPVAGKEWMQPWIEQFYHEGITTGCGAGPLYCPERNVTRAEMAVFIGRAYSIPLAP